MRRPLDLSVYLVTDRPLCRGRELVEVVAASLAGGATVVQLREKEAGTREFVELARALAALCEQKGVPLFVNDRVDVALAAGAHGVHVGQSDMRISDVRALVGPDMLLGLSIDDESQLTEAAGLDVDYLGIGPVYPTATKKDAGAALGISRFAAAVASTPHKVVGIGSINAATAADVIRAGAAGVAVVSAICAAGDPCAATGELARIVAAARS